MHCRWCVRYIYPLLYSSTSGVASVLGGGVAFNTGVGGVGVVNVVMVDVTCRCVSGVYASCVVDVVCYCYR